MQLFYRSIFPFTLFIFFSIFTTNIYAEIKDNQNCEELIQNIYSTGQDDNQVIKIVLKSSNDLVACLLKAFKNANYLHRKKIGNFLIQIGADAIPELERTLLGEDEDLAADSAILLGEIGNQSIPSLKKVFLIEKYSYNRERKMEAAYALGRIGPDAYPAMIEVVVGIDEPGQGTILLRDALIYEGQAATPYLIEALNDNDPVRRIIAAIVLGNIKDESSVPALIEAFSDKDKAVCTQVAWALSRLGKKAKQAAPVIIDKLKELEIKDSLIISEKLKSEIYVNFQSQAIDALDKIGAEPKEALPLLVRYMKHNNSEIRSTATRVVGRYKNENGARIEALINASNDIKGAVRKVAIESFERNDAENSEVMRLVMLRLNDPDPSVRGAAAKTLGKFKDEHDTIIPQLIVALKDPNVFVRSQSAYSLGEFGEYSKEALPELIHAVHDENINVRLESVKAIGRIQIGSNEVLQSLRKSFTTEIGQIQIEAANSLQNIGLASVPVFVETLRHKDEEIRKLSAEKLGNINPKAFIAIPGLISALKDISNVVREKSARALGNIGPASKEAITDLIALLDDYDQFVKKAVIDALGKIGHEASISLPKLIDILNGDNDNLKKPAINTIGKFGSLSKDAVPYLNRIIESNNTQFLSVTINALGNIGPAAADSVPILIDQLNHSRNETRRNSAEALGTIGHKAKAAIPYLLISLKDDDQEVKYRTADALADIAKAISDNKDVSAIGMLEEIATNFKANSELVTERYQKNEHYKTLIREISHLKALRIQNIMNFVGRFIVNHPNITAIIVIAILWIFICHVILWFWPLKLIAMNKSLGHYEWQIPDWVGGGGLKIKLRYILYFGFLNYRDKVLNKWVFNHIDIALKRFNEKRSVKLREIYIPVPVIIKNSISSKITPDSIKTEFRNKNSCILISGEGGLGKTSLAFMIAKWASSKNQEERFFDFPMIPVLIENNLVFDESKENNPLISAIQYQIQDVTDSPPIDKDFVMNLITKKRTLIIIDHLSEMNQESREIIIKELSRLKINAVIVTSRSEEKLGGMTKTNIKPLRIAAEGLVFFIAAYLHAKEKRDLFDNNEFVESCHNFSTIIGESPTIFAKFYAEQLIGHKESKGVTKLPENLPDLMLSYLNDLNRNILEYEDRIIHHDSKILAWEALKESFLPSAFTIEKAKIVIGEPDAEKRLSYLENRLMVIETIKPENDMMRFLIDPLAEYLACLHIIETYRNDNEKWKEILRIIKVKQKGSTEINGFINALSLCVNLKGEKFDVPKFVKKELRGEVGKGV